MYRNIEDCLHPHELATTTLSQSMGWSRRLGAEYTFAPLLSVNVYLAQIHTEPEASTIARIITVICKLTGRQECLDLFMGVPGTDTRLLSA
jgi:hypothetical protein